MHFRAQRLALHSTAEKLDKRELRAANFGQVSLRMPSRRSAEKHPTISDGLAGAELNLPPLPKQLLESRSVPGAERRWKRLVAPDSDCRQTGLSIVACLVAPNAPTWVEVSKIPAISLS